jgi:hypothetical protein
VQDRADQCGLLEQVGACAPTPTSPRPAADGQGSPAPNLRRHAREPPATAATRSSGSPGCCSSSPSRRRGAELVRRAWVWLAARLYEFHEGEHQPNPDAFDSCTFTAVRRGGRMTRRHARPLAPQRPGPAALGVDSLDGDKLTAAKGNDRLSGKAGSDDLGGGGRRRPLLRGGERQPERRIRRRPAERWLRSPPPRTSAQHRQPRGRWLGQRRH